jgi:inosine-uridine nucleoside N-ribohydrolase
MAAFLALALCVAGDAPAKTPVVLTTDVGVEVDDQWALTHLALSPRVDLRAVVTTHSPNFTSADSAKAARTWLDRLPFKQKPTVVAGSGKPLPDLKTPLPNPGVDLILKESRSGTEERRVVVFVIGAATDIASAILLDPTIADRIEVIAMGFSAWPEGGDPWNVKNDVRAWQVLLGSKVRLTVGDAAVCKRHLPMSVSRSRFLFGATGVTGEALSWLLVSWLSAHRDLAARETGNPDAWPIWDEVTVAHLLGLTRYETLPRPALRDDLSLDHSRPDGTVTWIKSLDTGALWDDLAAALRDAR